MERSSRSLFIIYYVFITYVGMDSKTHTQICLEQNPFVPHSFSLLLYLFFIIIIFFLLSQIFFAEQSVTSTGEGRRSS